MAWTNPNTVHNPTTGAVIPASWGAMVNQNLLHLRNSPETAGAYRDTAQTINNATVTALSFTTELWDNTDMFGSPPTRFRAPTDGRYLFTATVSFRANGNGHRTVWLRDSRSGGSFGIHRQNATPSDTTNICCSGIVGLLANDYVEVYVEQNSGGPLGVNWARAALIRLGG